MGLFYSYHESDLISSMPRDILFYIISFISTYETKQFTSTNKKLRGLLPLILFKDPIRCEHLSVCPCPQNHDSIIIGYQRDNSTAFWESLSNPTVPGVLCIPKHIRSVTFENDSLSTYQRKAMTFRLCTNLKELHLGKEKDFNVPIPETIELISYESSSKSFKKRMADIPNLPACEGKLEIRYKKFGNVLRKSVPKSLRVLCIHISKDMCHTYNLPFENSHLTMNVT